MLTIGRRHRRISGNLIRAAAVVGTAIGGAAQAQNQTLPAPGTLARPSLGGTLPPSAPPPRIITSSQDTEVLRHRDFGGKPCLAIGGLARAHLGNPNLFDHVIQIQNGCPKSITTQVCYRHSYECISVVTDGHASREAILGTQPAMRDFEYEFRERF